MNSQADKENSLFRSNLFKIKPFKSRKHKSLETKINPNPFINISFGQNLNSVEKIKHILCQEANTPEFGLDRKNRFSINPLSQKAGPARLKRSNKSSEFQMKMHSLDVVPYRPLIQKSKKIPDVFFQAIQYKSKPFKDLDLLAVNEVSSANYQMYLPKANQKNQNYKNLQSQKINFKQNYEKIDKLLKFYPQIPRNLTNINLLRSNRLKKIQ